MCNDESDFNCINKYKCKLNLFDKIVLSFTFIVMACCIVLMFIGIFNPQYIMCN